MPHNRCTATYTTYLFQGFDDEHKRHLTGYADLYERHADEHGGEVGIVMDLFYCADLITHYIKQMEQANENLWDRGPGVMEYEVIAELGAWLFKNPDAFDENPDTLDDWIFYMKNTIAQWFNPTAASAAQPESESTMKLSELISKLQAIADEQNGDLDVLTRGSEAHKMVDAADVRVVKTSKRTAVFIGKAKAD